MNKLILYPIIALIIILLLAVLWYFAPTIALVISVLIGAGILALFFIGIANLFNDWGKKPIMYVIKRGNHYANYIIPKCRIVKKRYSVTKTFILTRSCLYHFDDGDNSVNKLWGLTFGINPMKNSIRFGWNCENNDLTINIFMFKHVNGLMEYHQIANVLPDEKYEYTIEIDGFIAKFFINGEFKTSTNIRPKGFVILNKPYFGGKKTAPQDMIIIQK